jgi:excisionase family DNA binding protein
MEEELISVQETAKRLKVGIETVRRYIRAGEFEVAKVGRQYLIKPSTVQAFINKQFADTKVSRKPAVGEDKG